MIELNFRPVRPYSELEKIENETNSSGIYIWGFKFSKDDKFLPYYVGMAWKETIYKRLDHHFKKLDTTYRILYKEHLKNFYRFISDDAHPKIKDKDKFVYINETQGRIKSKDNPKAKEHIDYYREHFYYTYAPYKTECKAYMKYIETYVKYSLPENTISESLDKATFECRKKECYSEKFILGSENNEVAFRSEPSLFDS